MRTGVVGALLAIAFAAAPAAAQELEPGAYTVSPVGLNLLNVGYVFNDGDVTSIRRCRSKMEAPRFIRPRLRTADRWIWQAAQRRSSSLFRSLPAISKVSIWASAPSPIEKGSQTYGFEWE